MEEQKIPSKVEEAVSKLVTELVDTIQAAKTLIGSEAPEVAQQLLRYQYLDEAVNLAYDVAWMVLVPVVLYAVHCCLFHIEGYAGTASSIGLGAVSIISLCSAGSYGQCAMDHVTELLKIKCAPKLYILEYLKSLV
jgi:hypothetical protein